MKAYEAALLAASITAHAPWHVIPANSNLMISSVLIDPLKKLKMRYLDPVAGAADTGIE